MKSHAPTGKSREEFFPLKVLSILSILIAIFSFSGCGKKGPPVAPDMKPLPTVDSLRSKLSGDMLQLVWDAPSGESLAEPDGYYVYRAIRRLDDDCENCPDSFQKVADVSATSGFLGTRRKVLTHKEPIEEGYLYRYKVAAYSDPEMAGDFSNTVEISY